MGGSQSFAAKLLAAIVIGNPPFRVVVRLPFGTRYGVDMATRHMLHLIGRDDLANPDDMEVIVGLAGAVVAMAIGAVIVWGSVALVRRRAVRRAHV